MRFAYSLTGGRGAAAGHAHSLVPLPSALRALPAGFPRVEVASAGALVDFLISASEARAAPRLPLASQDGARLTDARQQILEQVRLHPLAPRLGRSRAAGRRPRLALLMG